MLPCFHSDASRMEAKSKRGEDVEDVIDLFPFRRFTDGSKACSIPSVIRGVVFGFHSDASRMEAKSQ